MAGRKPRGTSFDLPAAKRQGLSGQVADILKGFIIQTPLETGAALPAERHLAASLDISRSALREALSKLLGEQILERMPAGELRVADFDRAKVAAELAAIDSQSVQDLNVLRVVVELGAIEVVARLGSAEQVAEIENWVAQGERQVAAGEPWTREEVGFHAALLRAVGSDAVASLVPMLEATMRQSLLWEVEELDERPRSDARRSVTEHRRIVEALKRRDADGARQTMLAHLAPYLDRRWYERAVRAEAAPARDMAGGDGPPG